MVNRGRWPLRCVSGRRFAARLVARFLAAAAVVGVFGFAAGNAVSRSVASPAQALRTCVDRWNQGNMLGWGSMSVRIAIRPLNARERDRLVIPDHAQRRCTLSLADRPGQNSWICRIDDAGGYDCPLVTSDGMPPLRNANGKTDRRGVLKLGVPLKGTHATPPLFWQRRYPHVDGFILPWSASGQLRRGLRFTSYGHGWCSHGTQAVIGAPRHLFKVLFRCGPLNYSWRADPCFAKTRPVRRGDVVACAGPPGSIAFLRFKITQVH